MRSKIIIAAGLLASVAPAAAQLVPDVGGITGSVGGIVGSVTAPAEPLLSNASALASNRVDMLRSLVSANPDRLETIARGEIAVRGETLFVDPTDEDLAAVMGAGFAVADDERLDGLGLRIVTLAAPDGMSARSALRRLRRLAPDATFTPNHVYWQSGSAAPATARADATLPFATSGTRIGIIDGGAAVAVAFEQRGFALGAPRPSSHGTAVASLIAGGNGIRPSAPGAALYIADVYGNDPAGGNARAISSALGWFAAKDVPVVSISLAGPPNLLLERTIAAVRARGIVVVAAVGNDGPAAPPAYPASYVGVVAVTGVDARGRALVEAGRARHVDFAAPGADMLAAQPAGAPVVVRGTSFAAPFVAARIASHYPRRDQQHTAKSLAALAAEAVDLGRKGPDKVFGQGLVCGKCRTIP